jgi:hypothetical protein
MTSSQVNDAEAAHADGRRWSQVPTLVVGAPVPHGCHHPADRRLGGFPVFKSNYAADSAHETKPRL